MELYVVIYFVTSCIQDNEQRLLYSFNRSEYMDRSVLGVELILQTNKLSMSTKMIFRPVLLFLSNLNERRSSNCFSYINTYNTISVLLIKIASNVSYQGKPQYFILTSRSFNIRYCHYDLKLLKKKVLFDEKKIIGMHCIPLMLYRLNYELAIFESIYNCKFNVRCHVMHCKPHSYV